MTTKAKSATTTAPKKSKKEIEKPVKVLTEPLQHKKDLLEQLGWTITESADKKWTGERLSGDDPWKISEDKISSLLNSIIGIEETNLISDLTDDESVAMLEWRVKGWKFEQDEDLMWSATKGEQFVGKMSDLRPLLSCIEGEETGDHKTAIEKMTAQVVADEIEKYRDEGWHFVEPSEPGKSTWLATNSSPAFPDNIRAETLPGIFDQIKAIKKSNADRLRNCIHAKTLTVGEAQETSSRERITIELPSKFFESKSALVKSNSLNSIGDKGKINTPFEYQGKKYVYTSSCSSKYTSYQYIAAYQVIPAADFTGTALTYSEHLNLPHNHPDRWSYNRIAVEFKKSPFVLIGPEIHFVPEKTQIPLDSSASAFAKQHQEEIYDAGWRFKIFDSEVFVFRYPQNLSSDKPELLDKHFEKLLNSLGWKSQTQLHREAVATKTDPIDFAIPDPSRRDLLEAKGWKISHSIETNWRGEKLFVGDDEPTIQSGWSYVNDLCFALEEIERKHIEKEKIVAGNQDWKLPMIQQFTISEYLEKYEVSALYQTDKAIVEVEYKNTETNKATSVFIDETGGEHHERKKFFGRSDLNTLISVEDFYKKFPHFAPKKTAAAFLKNQKSASGSEILIDLDLIVPSPFLSQTKRRARFTDEEISELASTIDQDGLISPIVVRVVGDNFEIVAGERRWLATQKLGKTQIAAFIKELSEQSAYRIQLIENLQRKQPEPLDEAVTYKEYMDKFGLTVQDLALEFGKPVKFIAGRLKLNDLIPDAFAAVESKRLPIGHAFEIAKHPAETQKTILKKAVYDSIWVGKDNPQAKDGYLETVKPLAKLKDFIRRDVFHNLETASFSKSSEVLFPKGLSCKECPQRTHAKNLSSLFESDVISEQDQCLNPVCFGKRYDAHIEFKVQEIAAEENRPAEEVPYLTSEYSSKYNGRDTIQSWKYQEANKKNKCETTQKGVFIDGSQKGLVISFCLNKECLIHWKQAEVGQTDQKLTSEEKRERKLREDENNQDTFERRLRTATKRKLLLDISSRENFEEEFFADNELMSRLVAQVFNEGKQWRDSAIIELCQKSGYEIVEEDETDEHPTGWENSILKMDHQTRLQILFLSLLGYDNTVYDTYSILDTKNLAERFTFDYKRIEAEVLVEITEPNFKAQAVNYLEKITAGEDVKKPCFYFEKDYPDHPLDDDDDDDDIDENDIGETSQG